MINYMQTALQEAQKSSGDIPVGAVIVHNNKIIARAYNTREKNNDITSHAEIIALRQASKLLNNWRLEGCDIYVNLEPCPMCGWALLQSRLNSIYFGSYNLNYGAFSKCRLDAVSAPVTKIYGGIMEKECSKLLEDYFKSMR